MESWWCWMRAWVDSELCKLCLIYSRSQDLVKVKHTDILHELLIKIADLIQTSAGRSYVFANSFNIVKQITNLEDPYKHVKKELNQVGVQLAQLIRGELEAVGWDIRIAMRFSAAANIIDTSTLGYEPLDLQKAIWHEPFIEEEVVLPRNKHIYLVLDNAGEAAVDLLLAYALMKNGYRVSIIVRSESYEIDVLKDDLMDLRELIDEDVEIIETPGNMPPIFYIDNDDSYVIAKGIANLEASLEINRTNSLHLLRAKCDVLAKALRVPKNSPLIITGETFKKVIQENMLIREQSSKV
ncbi:MAG: ARMT1-like domain-containing protein [Desulfurococcaceae archaeon]